MAARLLGASVVAQIAVLAATAIALPSLNPRDLALYGFVMGASTMTVTFSTWAAETRIAVADLAAAHALRRTSIAVITGVAALWLLGGLALLPYSSHWSTAGMLAACGSATLGVHALAAAVMLRAKQQGRLADARVVQGLVNALLILALLVSPMPNALVLPLAWVLSICASVAVMAQALGQEWWSPQLPRRKDWAVLRLETGKQPLANVLAGAVEPMPLVLLPIVAPPAVAGAWALLTRFLQPLVMTVYSALQPVYYGQAAELARDGRWQHFDRWHRRWLSVLLVGLVPAGAAFYLIAWSLPRMLGPEWSSSPWLAWAASFYFASLLVCLPLSQTLLLLGRMELQLRWAASRFLLSVAPFLASGWWGPRPTVLIWVLAASGVFYVQLLLHRHAIAEGLGSRAADAGDVSRPPQQAS